MTIDERLERLTEVAKSQAESIQGLVRAAEGHQDQIDAHDAQIEALIAIDEKRAVQLDALLQSFAQTRAVVADLAKQCQAYINTLPRQ